MNNIKYFYHGTSLPLEVLTLHQATDSNGSKANNDNAVFLTPSFEMACAHAFRQKTKENSQNLNYNISIHGGQEPLMIMENVNELNDDDKGYVYVFNYSDDFINDPVGSLQYKSYKPLKPIQVIEVYYKDYKHLFSVNKENISHRR